eukprot:TRINITY_DN2404_c0_g1_i1.p1 TRINITY_DN2404_c0_g1~~TRINITY_DN2404_c0_g1_i1.p1  ORF type:complete len:490 (+),score=110.32 TRINITY_DN2404_c0_g1_i1:365-1834(+)
MSGEIMNEQNSSDQELLELFQGYSWVPLHNLGCFFLELGNTALAKQAFQLSNSTESLMALADLYYLEKDYVSSELIWRRVDTSESLEKICEMKEKMAQLDGITFLNYFTSKEPPKERTRTAQLVDTTSLVTNDRLDQLYRTVLLLERQQQQQQQDPKKQADETTTTTTTIPTITTTTSTSTSTVQEEPKKKEVVIVSSSFENVSESDIKDVEQEGEAAMLKFSQLLKQKERSISSNNLDFRKPEQEKPVISNPRATRHTLHIPNKETGTLGRNVPDGLKKVLMEEGILSEAEMAKFEEIAALNAMNKPEPTDTISKRSSSRDAKGLRRSISNIFTKHEVEHEHAATVSRVEKAFSENNAALSSSSNSKQKGLLKRMTSTRSKSEIITESDGPSPRKRSSSHLPKLFLKISGSGDKDKDKGALSPTASGLSRIQASSSSSSVMESPKVSGPVRVAHKGHVGIDLLGNLSYDLPPDIMELLKPGVNGDKKK